MRAGTAEVQPVRRAPCRGHVRKMIHLKGMLRAECSEVCDAQRKGVIENMTSVIRAQVACRCRRVVCVAVRSSGRQVCFVLAVADSGASVQRVRPQAVKDAAAARNAYR